MQSPLVVKLMPPASLVSWKLKVKTKGLFECIYYCKWVYILYINMLYINMQVYPEAIYVIYFLLIILNNYST